jgi:DNA repair exonuclease SbcCD ATPase subunit
MKKMLFALVAIVPCAFLLWATISGNEKLAQLRIESQRQENELQAARKELSNLESENVRLRTENAKLQETDQALFSKGVEEHLAASSKDGMRLALGTFTELTMKFPKSALAQNAKQHIAELQKSISDIEQLEAARSKFEDALKADRFKDASEALQQLSSLISADERKSLSSRLYEAENRPIEMTVNELVSRFGSLVRSGNLWDLLGKRVKVEASFGYIARDRKSIEAHNDSSMIGGTGTHVTVFYAGSNMEERFTRGDPDPQRRYTITGVVRMFANVDEPYILAEIIE